MNTPRIEEIACVDFKTGECGCINAIGHSTLLKWLCCQGRCLGFYDRMEFLANDLSKIRTSDSNCRDSSAIMLCDRRARMLHYNKGDRKDFLVVIPY